eukprot:7317987-Prorocentrum_lima.AAC.1
MQVILLPTPRVGKRVTTSCPSLYTAEPGRADRAGHLLFDFVLVIRAEDWFAHREVELHLQLFARG